MIGRSVDLGALAPYWQTTRDWWGTRSDRERVLLTILAAIASVALLLAILLPLREARQDARETIRNADLIEAHLRSGNGALARSGPMRTGTPSAIVTNSLAAAQLQVGRVAAEGDAVRLTLENAPFDAVMIWVADVETTSNLRVRDVDITGQPAPGTVSASIVLGR